MELKRKGLGRKGALFGFTTSAVVMTLGANAFACVVAMGRMDVDGHDGDTTVVGKGYNDPSTSQAFEYCTNPTNAAAGHLQDTVTVTLSAEPTTSTCPGQLPAGVYEVKYNHEKTHTYNGTSWPWIDGTGCFNGANSASSWPMGTFVVDATGSIVGGSWTGVVDPGGLTKHEPDQPLASDIADDPDAAQRPPPHLGWDKREFF